MTRGGFSSNDWPESILAPLEGRLSLKASVVIPAYGNPDRLDSVIAALGRQSYPAELTEVIVADDGSDPPLAPVPPKGMNLKIVRQANLGARPGLARDLGASNASGDFLAFVDSDMLPEPQWLEAHARVHHRHPWALSIGFRKEVTRTDVHASEVSECRQLDDLFRGFEYQTPKWLEETFEKLGDNRKDVHQAWRTVSGGNFSVGMKLYRESGGNSPLFVGWGGEDNEFGYRVIQKGALVIPNRDAMAWHLGLTTSTTERGQERLKQVRLLLDSRIPLAGFVKPVVINSDTPELAVDLDGSDSTPNEVIESVASLLAAARGHSIGIRLSPPKEPEPREMVERLLAFDSRVSVQTGRTALDLWPNSRVHLSSSILDWSPSGLKAILSQTSEGASGIVKVIREGTVAEAVLVRVLNQVRFGILDPKRLFEEAGGIWLEWNSINRPVKAR